MLVLPLRRCLTLVVLLGVVLGLVGVSTPALAAATRTVTIKASTLAVVAGGPVSFSGRISGSPVGSPVQVQRKVGSRWVLARSASTTSTAGNYSAAVKLPKASGAHFYRVVAPATGALKTTASRTVKISALRPVKATIGATPKRVLAGAAVTLKGSVKPYARRSGVVVQRLVGSTWRTLTTTKLTSSGNYTKVVRPTVTTKYRLSVPRRGANAPAVSGATTVTVMVPPRITTVTMPTAAQAFPYSVQLGRTGGAGTWSIASGFLPFGDNMKLSASTGVISGTPSAIETATFTVRFTETSTRLTATRALSIKVVPSVPPSINTATLPNATKRSPYSAQLAKTGAPGKWSVLTGTLPAGVQLDADTGEIAGTPLLAGTSNVTVKYTENLSGLSDTQPLTLTVDNVLPTITTVSLGNATQGKPYGTVLAKTGGAGTWSLNSGSNPLPTGITIDPATGALSGTPALAGSYTFTVKFTESDANASTATRALSLVVNQSSAPEITTTNLPNGTQGQPYPSTVLTATGLPGTWSITAGSLPTGITLAGNTLSGTPTVAGDFGFTVTYTETGSGLTDSQPLSIHLEPSSPTAPVITTTTVPNATQGVGYSTQLAKTGLPGTWSLNTGSGAWPDGITLNQTSGVISGTPTVSGVFNVTVKFAETTGGLSDTQALTLTVIAGTPPVIETTSLQEAIKNTGYSATLNVTGDPGTWSITGLPSGLAVTPTTGQISGTPNASGNFMLTITYRENASTQTATKQLNLYVANASNFVIQTDSLPNGTVGAAYSAQLATNAVLGGWSLAPGSGPLPTGLSVSGTGKISGTPTVAGTYAVKVRYTVLIGLLGSEDRVLTLTVVPAG